MIRLVGLAFLFAAALACSGPERPNSDARRAMLQASCAAGDLTACYRLGTYLEYVESSPAAALPLYLRACDGKVASACTNLGSLYGRGSGVARDDAKAAALYRNACDRGDATACANLADFLMRGTGVTADPAAGLALYGKACEAGDKIACRDLGATYVSGDRVPRDPTLGARWLQKGCDLGSAQACGDLANIYDRGSTGVRDPAMARRLYRRSCDGVPASVQDGPVIVLHWMPRLRSENWRSFEKAPVKTTGAHS